MTPTSGGRWLPPEATLNDKLRLQRQFNAMDWQIDRLNYEPYGLIEEELRIVEMG